MLGQSACDQNTFIWLMKQISFPNKKNNNINTDFLNQKHNHKIMTKYIKHHY